MDTVKHIFRKPDYIDGIGYIYPVQLKDYDDFMAHTNIICLSYEHFDIEEIKKHTHMDDIKLLDLIIIASLQDGGSLGIYNLTKVFRIILQADVRFDQVTNTFYCENGKITRDNYDRFRDVVMSQNLLFTPKVYKNKKLQEWAEKAIKARAKSSVSSTIEDQISTVSVLAGKDYDTIKNWSIYQLSMEFNRVIKIEAYRTSIKQLLAGAQDVKPEHFIEIINLFKNPYDDLFKDKNKGKLKDLNSAIQGS
ncbi:MAG: hypothetical protein ACI35O_02420 [Bacillaceae bacterium]